jgi:hypothetical protein
MDCLRCSMLHYEFVTDPGKSLNPLHDQFFMYLSHLSGIGLLCGNEPELLKLTVVGVGAERISSKMEYGNVHEVF